MAALRPLPALLSGLPIMVERPMSERAKEVGLVLNLLLGSLVRMLQPSCSSPTLSCMTKPHFVQISSPDSTSIIFSAVATVGTHYYVVSRLHTI